MNAALNPEFEPTPDPKFELPIQDYSTFYRFYLTEHRNIMSRRLHVVGSSIGLYCVSKAIRHKKPNMYSMVCWQAMLVHGSGTLFLKKINLPVLNSLCIVLFQTGGCLPMFCVVI